MTSSDYTAGTVSIEAGSTSLQGDGTAWSLAGFREGDVLFLRGYVMVLDAVESDTEATLTEEWPGATVEDAAYRLRYEPDLSRAVAKFQELIDGLADQKGEKGDPGDNFSPDAVGLFADRDDYDDEAEGFAYLATDGDGDEITSAVIFIRVGAPGSWTAAIPFQGPPGDDGDPGVPGPRGIEWRGAWNAGTAYAPLDAVRHEGSSYIAIAATTGDAPPNETYWDVLALAGAGDPDPDPELPENLVTQDGAPIVHGGAYVVHTP